MFFHKHFSSVRFTSRRRGSNKMKKPEQAPEQPEDLKVELLHSAPSLPMTKAKAKGKPPRFFWKCGGPSRRRRRRPECVVCLQVHEIRGLPPALDGRAVAVGWSTKGWRGEMTLPVTVLGGEARFEEIFLHHCSGDAGGAMRGFCIWVSLIDSGDCDLGRFEVDITGMVPANKMDAKFGGKVQRFELCGQGKGGELSVSVYCRMVGVEFSGPLRRRSGDCLHVENKVHAAAAAEPKQDDQQSSSKCRCFPCLRDPKPHKNRNSVSSQQRRSTSRSLPSEQYGLITMDSFSYGERRSGGGGLPSSREGNSGFITIDKGAVCPPPSSSSFDAEDDEGAAPYLLTGYTCSEEDDEKEGEVEEEDDDEEDTDVKRIEEEFLQMLEDEKCIPAKGFTCDSLDAELESLIKMAEADMAYAPGSRKVRTRAGGAALEREEYEELLKGWGSSMRKLAASSSSSFSSSSSSSTYRGNDTGVRFGSFGSPF